MIFGPNNIKYFNELEINGQPTRDEDDEEYTATPQDDTEDETTDDVPAEEESDDTGNDLEDFTEDEFVDDEEDDEATEDATTEDDTPEEQPADDEATEDAEDPADDETEDPTDDGNDLEDFTEDEFVDDEEDDEATDDEGVDEGDEEDTDYTQMTDDGDDTADDDGSKDDGKDTNNKDSNIGNKLSDMEKNLFADLTPQQLAIKNNELLQNYIALYDAIGEIFDNVNKIPKTYDNTRPLTFIADQLVELKDMVNYIITTTYITRTYVENMTYYKQSLVILTQLNTMIKELIKKQPKK